MHGRVLEAGGRPVPETLVEVWQCNATGRYRHQGDQHPAPLDPNFTGLGRCLTGADGSFAFVTVKPGAYPWGNHHNAWRPAHIHFSVFGRAFAQRLVTQMYFPGDPLFAPGPDLPVGGRGRATGSWPRSTSTAPSPSGRSPTAGTSSWPGPRSRMPEPTPPQTVGPFFSIGL